MAITRVVAEQMSKAPGSVKMAAPGTSAAAAASAPQTPAGGASKLIIP